jgi:hypothetical protein
MDELAERVLSAGQPGDEVEWPWDRDTRLGQLQLDEYPPGEHLGPRSRSTRTLQHRQ